MTLGQRIQALRKEKGLSQEALGEALGVSRQAVSQWEADASLPELDKLVGLSRLFGLPLGDLLQLEETRPGFKNGGWPTGCPPRPLCSWRRRWYGRGRDWSGPRSAWRRRRHG